MDSTSSERNDPQRPGTLPADEVRRVFAAIVPRYDLLNCLLSFGLVLSWRRAAARMLPRGAALVVADLCAGTGDLTAALARRLGLQARVFGVDFCEPMVHRAQQKFGRLPCAAFVVGDALRLPLADGQFDAATMAFGLRNVADARQVLAEMLRVVRPRGQVLILDFCLPRGRATRAVCRFYFRRLLPLIGRVVSGHGFAYSYLPASVERFLSPEQLASLLEAAGAAEVTVRRLAGGVALLLAARKSG